MKAMLIELRAGEGGMDSKLFLNDMARMYSKYLARAGASMELL